jgi:hypothetical protein
VESAEEAIAAIERKQTKAQIENFILYLFESKIRLNRLQTKPYFKKKVMENTLKIK